MLMLPPMDTAVRWGDGGRGLGVVVVLRDRFLECPNMAVDVGAAPVDVL